MLWLYIASNDEIRNVKIKRISYNQFMIRIQHITNRKQNLLLVIIIDIDVKEVSFTLLFATV